MTTPHEQPLGVFEFLALYPVDNPQDALIECVRCKTQQPPDEFCLARPRKLIAEGRSIRGSSRRCRQCNRELAIAYRAPKVEIINAARASGCVDCGIVDLEHPEIFDFDHVLPGKVKFVSTYLTSGTVEELLAEIARCEVVCANCHRIRTRSRASGTKGHDLRG